MIGNIFFNGAGKIGVLEMDVTVSENHSMRSDVTDSPVEDGTDISDHIRNAPRALTIEGVISKTPVNVQHFNPLRYRQAFKKLEQLHNDRVPVTVVTSFKTYKNMAVLQIDVRRDRDSGNIVQFTASLRQVRIVKTGKDALAADVEDSISDESDLGPQSGSEL